MRYDNCSRNLIYTYCDACDVLHNTNKDGKINNINFAPKLYECNLNYAHVLRLYSFPKWSNIFIYEMILLAIKTNFTHRSNENDDKNV